MSLGGYAGSRVFLCRDGPVEPSGEDQTMEQYVAGDARE